MTRSPRRLPRQRLDITAARTCATTVLAGIRAGEPLAKPSQARVQTPSGCDDSAIAKICPLTVAGAAQVRFACKGISLLLPVELQRVNHTASTNSRILRRAAFRKPYNARCMSNPIQIDQIAERVDRLLVRYGELQRTNALLSTQVDALTHERDTLKSRLSAARARVDALLDKLPEASVVQKELP